jgi:hypothetical protein
MFISFLYMLPSSLQVEKFLSDLHSRRSPTQSDTYQMLYWYNWLSWWWSRGCSKHVENWNKHIEKRNCASNWSFTGIIPRCMVYRTLYWDARSAEHYTETHSQQNIILRCTVSRTLYWDTRSAVHYTEMHGQQNIILRYTVSSALYWDARSAEHYTEMHGQQNIIPRCMVSRTLYRDAWSTEHKIFQS